MAVLSGRQYIYSDLKQICPFLDLPYCTLYYPVCSVSPALNRATDWNWRENVTVNVTEKRRVNPLLPPWTRCGLRCCSRGRGIVTQCKYAPQSVGNRLERHDPCRLFCHCYSAVHRLPIKETPSRAARTAKGTPCRAARAIKGVPSRRFRTSKALSRSRAVSAHICL